MAHVWLGHGLLHRAHEDAAKLGAETLVALLNPNDHPIPVVAEAGEHLEGIFLEEGIAGEGGSEIHRATGEVVERVDEVAILARFPEIVTIGLTHT